MLSNNLIEADGRSGAPYDAADLDASRPNGSRSGVEKVLLTAFDRMGVGGIIMDGVGTVIDFNATAARLLDVRNSAAATDLGLVRNAVKAVLRRAGSRFNLSDKSWALVQRNDRRPLAIYAIPCSHSDDLYSCTVLTLVDLDETPSPSSAALQRLFALTAAEAALAIAVARGVAPNEFAREKGVKLTTVRTQLASIFAKTRTKRQADIVALLARVAILP